eukprot:CAMPEP_0171625790 /NCGR_PEP_ID=MMETSP0990-20121206/19612_1 /TAXON_ID=483369 /ORGANISM="non described non described, Strain CCMP2098" /LENGTH=118 /DNA_ID=CAMNT_0012192973 /DNA_START=90 /DNA_END=446 /DNA_ORIENTATION=+
MSTFTLLLILSSVCPTVLAFLYPPSTRRSATQTVLASSSSTEEAMGRRSAIAGAASFFAFAAPSYALREPEGSVAGKGKYDTMMDPLVVLATYGKGDAAVEARKTLRAQGKKIPKPQS